MKEEIKGPESIKTGGEGPGKRILIYIVLLIIGAILWSLVPKCEGKKTVSTEPLKAKIRSEIKTGDSLKKIVVKNDSVRIKYVVKWRKLKNDTVFLPCDSMLKKVVTLCDTLILIDSTEISNLKRVVLNDSLIISDQDKVIKGDSVLIAGLNKQVKKERRRKKFWIVVASALGLVAVIK